MRDSDFFFQNLPELLQPSLRLVHCGSMCPDDIPETGRMVGLDEMSEFMHNDVVDDEHWRFYQPPIEIDIVFQSA